MKKILKIEYKSKKAYKLLLCLEELKVIKIVDNKTASKKKNKEKKEF